MAVRLVVLKIRQVCMKKKGTGKSGVEQLINVAVNSNISSFN